MSTQAPIDSRAGWCSMCRRGSCELCASATCACITGADHALRPAPGTRPSPIRPESPKAAPPPSRQAPVAAKLTEAKWGLVKADPPAPARKPKPVRVTVVDQARPFVEQLVAEGTTDWNLLARFPKPKQASQVAGRLRKAFPGCEWKPVIGADQSGLYVRLRGDS